MGNKWRFVVPPKPDFLPFPSCLADALGLVNGFPSSIDLIPFKPLWFFDFVIFIFIFLLCPKAGKSVQRPFSNLFLLQVRALGLELPRCCISSVSPTDFYVASLSFVVQKLFSSLGWIFQSLGVDSKCSVGRGEFRVFSCHHLGPYFNNFYFHIIIEYMKVF